MRHRDRLIDPAGYGRGIREQRLGGVPERELVREQQKQGRYEWQTPLILTATLGPWFRENVPAGGAQTMRLLALDASSTTAGTPNSIYNSSAGGNAAFRMNNPVRIIGGGLHTPSTITAGSVTLGVRIDVTDVRVLSDVVLNAANTIGQFALLGWRRGWPVAAGQSITPVLVTDSGFLPVSADISAWLVLAWEEPA